MTNEELIVMRDLCDHLCVANKELRKAKDERYEAEQKSIAEELKRKQTENDRDRINYLLGLEKKKCDDIVARCAAFETERDEARRKLGALVLCVGFLKDYDARHPKKSLEALKAAVKKFIADNHITMTVGGVAK